MKRSKLQADLDPPNWPIKRPGGYAAERAFEQTRAGSEVKEETPEDPAPDSPTRPGGAAATRLVKALRNLRRKG